MCSSHAIEKEGGHAGGGLAELLNNDSNNSSDMRDEREKREKAEKEKKRKESKIANIHCASVYHKRNAR